MLCHKKLKKILTSTNILNLFSWWKKFQFINIPCIKASLWSRTSLPSAVEESISVRKRMCTCNVRGEARHAREVRAASSPQAHSLCVINCVGIPIRGRTTRWIFIFQLWKIKKKYKIIVPWKNKFFFCFQNINVCGIFANIAPVVDVAAKLLVSRNKVRISQQASNGAPYTHPGANPTSKPETLTSLTLVHFRIF